MLQIKLTLTFHHSALQLIFAVYDEYYNFRECEIDQRTGTDRRKNMTECSVKYLNIFYLQRKSPLISTILELISTVQFIPRVTTLARKIQQIQSISVYPRHSYICLATLPE